ncbi:hypothetical protein [Kutzneria sp. NPDC052558]|uniref:hypothetical protein n=1 Tax=Kutzneria sp. NPDC052558 TaxID=3364121 RepID=UPI0037C93A10
MTTPAPPVTTVNVRDHGAVADGVVDCYQAFRDAVDALDPVRGGTVVIPAGPDAYLFRRSVIVDRPNVRFIGENTTTTVLRSQLCIPPLIFGVHRGLHNSPMSPAHWQDLHEILPDQPAGTKWGYRTMVPVITPAPGEQRPADRAIVSLPATPFSLGPANGPRGWTGLSQFTLDFTVSHNGGAWPGSATALFGSVDNEGRPAPFAVWLGTGLGGFVLLFDFVTDDGLWRQIRVPIADPSQSVLRCSIQLDLTTGAVATWINHSRVAPLLDFVNDGWGKRPMSLRRNRYAPFNLGTISPLSNGASAAGLLPGGLANLADLTFAAMRLSSTLQYAVDDKPAQRTLAGAEVTDAEWWRVSPGVFACLPMDQPPTMNKPVTKDGPQLPDLQVPWVSTPSGPLGFGLFVSADLSNGDTILGNAMERLTVDCGHPFAGATNYGQGIAVGMVYSFRLDDVTVTFGAQGLSSYNLGVSYPVELSRCQFGWQTDTAIYSYGQILRADRVGLSYYGNSALKAVRSTLSTRDIFVTDSASCESVVRMYECAGQFDAWTVDFESTTANLPSDSYFWASLGADIGPTQLVFRDCQVGAAGPQAVAVRLVSGDVNAGLATPSRNRGWCTIERSFNTFFDRGATAIVAVDGPLWQGTFTGPVPASPELVMTTAWPGASARIGLNGPVPPALTVPRPAVDPIPGLPGLIGYYSAEQVRLPAEQGGKRMPNEGEAIPSLNDLSNAHNDGAAVRTAPIYLSNQVNGRAALRFDGNGWYQFQSMTGTTGCATLFLVTKGNPLVDTAPGKAALQRYGLYWTMNMLQAPQAGSSSEWVVYAARYGKRPDPTDPKAPPARILDLWANGRRYETRRRDANGDVQFARPLLGSVNDGLGVFSGLVAAAVYVDGDLSDQQVELVNRFLVHQHNIAV